MLLLSQGAETKRRRATVKRYGAVMKRKKRNGKTALYLNNKQQRLIQNAGFIAYYAVLRLFIWGLTACYTAIEGGLYGVDVR